MVLEEAKILDKFIIITNTAGREAIANYKNSLIVDNNEEAIYEGLRRAIEDRLNAKDDSIDYKRNIYNNNKILEEIKEIL